MPPRYLAQAMRNRLLLLGDVFLSDLDLRLEGADADIGGGNVAEQCDQDLVVTGDRCEVGGVGRFDAATKLSPKVQFPVDRKAQRIAPKVGQETGKGVCCRVGVARPVIEHRARRVLHLREKLTDRHSKLGARLENASSGTDQRKVLLVGGPDQPIEDRVMKDCPPRPILPVWRADQRYGFDRRIA